MIGSALGQFNLQFLPMTVRQDMPNRNRLTHDMGKGNYFERGHVNYSERAGSKKKRRKRLTRDRFQLTPTHSSLILIQSKENRTSFLFENRLGLKTRACVYVTAVCKKQKGNLTGGAGY